MARTRIKQKGRKDTAPFLMLKRHIVESPEFAQLSAIAVKLLLDLYSQYRGNNNGDFGHAWKVMRRKGWKSKGTLYSALRELEANGWIVKTRQGGLGGICNLFAVTWLPIDECNGKLDVKPTRVPCNAWDKSQVRLSGQVGTVSVPIEQNFRKTG